MADRRPITSLPRLPLDVRVDLTYRCNNTCRHCWLWEPDDEAERARELTTGEWHAVIDQARALGTREWSISGGEPMLREDFAELFEHMTGKAKRYSLNTNGTLLTPELAALLTRRGSKMVAVYGATAEVYDKVTRNPGGFEALVQGLSYLKEAGAGFTVQLIPMRENWHQWEQMLEFARSWSRQYRIGAPWLFMSAGHDAARNAEIARQRLDPVDVVALDAPVASQQPAEADEGAEPSLRDDLLYAACIETRRSFHVDPYGGLTFCGFVKDPAMRFDLRAGMSVAESGAAGLGAEAAQRGSIPPDAVRIAWEEFIPGLAGEVRGGEEYRAACGACALRPSCRWCDVYGYLEHGRHGAKVEHLCAVAREAEEFKVNWMRQHRRFYEVGGVTVQVESDLPITDETFHRKFERFRREGPGDDTVVVRHHFGLPERDGADGAEEIYRRPPWAIYRKGPKAAPRAFVYHGISPSAEDRSLHRIAVFNADHTRGEIYNDDTRSSLWLPGGLASLTMFPSDQILLARLMADRDACFLHSGAVSIDGQGLLFAGHSEAGKSTTMLMLSDALGERLEILCDDRTGVRRGPRGFAGGAPGFYVHGTWSHGDVPNVSGAGVPLRAILFLEQSAFNEIVPMEDRNDALKRLLATLIRPMVTADWWEKEMDVVERIVAEVPCAVMRFDRTGAVVPAVEGLVR
jgi:MoaA/NifB/PqqE/SkfB family radical SAM enzyme